MVPPAGSVPGIAAVIAPDRFRHPRDALSGVDRHDSRATFASADPARLAPSRARCGSFRRYSSAVIAVKVGSVARWVRPAFRSSAVPREEASGGDVAPHQARLGRRVGDHARCDRRPCDRDSRTRRSTSIASLGRLMPGRSPHVHSRPSAGSSLRPRGNDWRVRDHGRPTGFDAHDVCVVTRNEWRTAPPAAAYHLGRGTNEHLAFMREPSAQTRDCGGRPGLGSWRT